MNSAIQPLNYEHHNQVKIQTKGQYFHTKNQQIVPVVIHEFSRTGAEMPIVFVKNTNTGEFQPVALLGFKNDENVFYANQNNEEKWLANYVPAIINHHPFALMPTENDANKLQIFLKTDSTVISTEEGSALFDEQGQETEYLKQRKNVLATYYENTLITKQFVESLADNDLLIKQQLTITLQGEDYAIDGVYLVNEKTLNELPDNEFLALRKRGYLSAIYIHLGSIHQLTRLAALKTK
ncbi:MAG: SapC family protein [Pseudomonadota bacterium]